MSSDSLKGILMKLYFKEVLGVAIQNKIIVIFPMLN